MANDFLLLRIFLVLFGIFYVIFFWGGNYIQKKITGKSPYALGIGKSGREQYIELLFNIIFLSWAIRLIILFLLPDLFISQYLLIDPQTSMFSGVILMITGLLGLAWVRITMKSSWRVGIDFSSETRLITTGPFRFSRNPVSLSFNLMFFGSYLLTQEILVLGLFVVNFIFLHLQILQEEKFLASRSIDGYEKYCKNVGRYFWKI
ncbi:MAG: methyltransferase family protein [Candidatus Hodarchaeales archaeon]|jgi:protein-S-isoprenylcysteine O-methyltransferase Ste14